MADTHMLFDRPGDFVDGRFVVPSTVDEVLEIRSPADLDEVVAIHPVGIAHVDVAVTAARNAFVSWRRLGLDARAKLLRAYQERVRHHAAAFTEILAREAGKARWDAASEAGALAAKVDLVLGEGAEWTRDRMLTDLPGEIRFRPHGVLAVLGPFNFPVHLPNGQILPALLLGNTVVFKPSEKCPSAAVLMMRCFEEAGFPPGVINLVQGGAKTAVALSNHDDVDGILFTGSVPVGRAIVATNAARPGRLVALELGGKNASIVLADADVEAAARHLAFAAYASAGQRCTATSRVFVAREVADQLVERFAEAARSVKVGHPLDEGVFMGPLVAQSAKSALLQAQTRARAAGFEAVVEGGDFDAGRRGHYVRPSVHLAPRADVRVEGYTHDELFGPDVAVYVVDDLDQAITLANDTEFGLAAAVFTASASAFEEAADRLRVGVLHWNQSSNGASGRLPFGGVKNSGNHRPAGITAGAFCAYPLAIRHAPPADAPLPSWPGLFG
jgi:succinylglutamic semialdehyde dehydrogenase